MAPSESKSMPIMGHLEELRTRLLRIIGAVAVGVVIGLIFSKEIYHYLTIPMQKVMSGESHFIATNPIEGFITYMRTGFVAGLFIAIPVIFFELWQFVAPGLYASEKKRSLIFVVMTSFFFIGGSLFGYFVVFPTSFEFFTALLTGSEIVFFPKMNEYFSFSIRLLLAFGIVFELPVLILLLARLGVVTAKMLKKIRPYTIVGVFIVAGLMTGPDVVSQLLMALPLLLLYEVGVVLAKVFGKSAV